MLVLLQLNSNNSRSIDIKVNTYDCTYLNWSESMSLKPWLNPWYIPSLVRNLENDFGITPYCNKTLVFPRPSFLKNAFRNFQWVKTEDVMIARCAQPGYSNSAGDKDHGFNTKQRKFLVENNIKTIISLNSKRHKTESANRLYGMGIEYHHISVVDFQALKVEDHERINKIIAMRKTMGGFLFYCGYGEGRTGTAVAGWMFRYIITCAPNYFVNFSLKQLHQFVSLAFGVEKPDQTYSIADYMKKMATVEPAPGSMKPRPLSEVSYASFEDSNGSIYSINNPPPVPSSKPVFN